MKPGKPIICLGILGAAGMLALLASCATAQDGPAVEKADSETEATTDPPLDGEKALSFFGKTRGEKVTEGIVLLEGKYLPPPYQIDRIGLTLVLNGEHLLYKGHWVKKAKEGAPMKPEAPRDLDEARSLSDLHYTSKNGIPRSYHGDMTAYFHELHPDNPEKAAGKIATFYGSLPFVKKVTTDPRRWWLLRVEFRDGTRTNMSARSEAVPELDQNDILEWLEFVRESTEEDLMDGGIALPCYPYQLDGTTKSIPTWERSQTRHLLQVLEGAIGETRDPERLKARFGKYYTSLRLDLGDWKVLAKNFEYSAELKRRVADYPDEKLIEAKRPNK